MRLIHTAATCGLIALNALAAFAQQPAQAPPKKDGTEVRELILSPRAIEQPLMKYRLLPAEYELQDGNAAPILLRLPWEQAPYFLEVVPKFDDYLALPLYDPKVLETGDVFSTRFYKQLRRAAYRRTADWEYPIGEGPLLNVLLPDAQGGRLIVGRGLSVWIRYHIAQGKLDEALEGVRVGLANNRHYARTPFIICQLIGTANTRHMIDRLGELISRPECPNLHWALAALPRPFIDLRPSIELEQHFLHSMVPELDQFDQSRTEAEWQALLLNVIEQFQDAGQFKLKESERQDLFKRLAEHGRAELAGQVEGGESRIQEMSDAEVGLRWFFGKHVDQSQEISALMSLEPSVAIPRLAALQQQLAEFRNELGINSLFVIEKPLTIYVNANGLQRQFDVLRVVEAIRAHAATNGGTFPSTLDEIKEVPIPLDSFTGKSFDYTVTNEVATLSAQGIESDGKVLAGVQYRLSIRPPEPATGEKVPE